jgi:hypothetical protein
MVDPRLKVIANVLLGYTGECTCHEGYTGRNLIDPECTYHSVPNEEAAADIIDALDGMGKAHSAAQEQPDSLWNVFLYDAQRKYGDHMVTVKARTLEAAETTALATNPGSSIAHPTALSPYAPVPTMTESRIEAAHTWGGMQGVIN